MNGLMCPEVALKRVNCPFPPKEGVLTVDHDLVQRKVPSDNSRDISRRNGWRSTQLHHVVTIVIVEGNRESFTHLYMILHDFQDLDVLQSRSQDAEQAV